MNKPLFIASFPTSYALPFSNVACDAAIRLYLARPHSLPGGWRFCHSTPAGNPFDYDAQITGTLTHSRALPVVTHRRHHLALNSYDALFFSNATPDLDLPRFVPSLMNDAPVRVWRPSLAPRLKRRSLPVFVRCSPCHCYSAGFAVVFNTYGTFSNTTGLPSHSL